jgi:hypothetical protein
MATHFFINSTDFGKSKGTMFPDFSNNLPNSSLPFSWFRLLSNQRDCKAKVVMSPFTKVKMSPFDLLRKGHVRENYYHESCRN